MFAVRIVLRFVVPSVVLAETVTGFIAGATAGAWKVAEVSVTAVKVPTLALPLTTPLAAHACTVKKSGSGRHLYRSSANSSLPSTRLVQP